MKFHDTRQKSGENTITPAAILRRDAFVKISVTGGCASAATTIRD